MRLFLEPLRCTDSVVTLVGVHEAVTDVMVGDEVFPPLLPLLPPHPVTNSTYVMIPRIQTTGLEDDLQKHVILFSHVPCKRLCFLFVGLS
jgi:hypothetical protein